MKSRFFLYVLTGCALLLQPFKTFAGDQPRIQTPRTEINISAEDQKVIEFMELLQKMEMLQDLDMMTAGEDKK